MASVLRGSHLARILDQWQSTRGPGGARQRLRGRGAKKPDGTRGDQFCRVEIAVPKNASTDADLRRLFEEIAKRTAGTAVRNF